MENKQHRWKHPGFRSSDYSLSADHDHDRRIYAAAASYRGAGPRGYNRDERLREEVCECLKWSPDVDASEIEVHVRDNCVFLDGSVDSRHAKKIAEEIAEDIFGVSDVFNNLLIRPTLDVNSDKIITRGDDGLYSEESIKNY